LNSSLYIAAIHVLGCKTDLWRSPIRSSRDSNCCHVCH